jgi:hypothetical protein
MDLFSKTVEYVDRSFEGKQKLHFERTAFWIQKFLPESTEAHKIAAFVFFGGCISCAGGIHNGKKH